MISSTNPRGRMTSSSDLGQGIAFVLLSLAMFVLLSLVRRPEWAQAWLIASLFTFVLWRLGRQPSPSH